MRLKGYARKRVTFFTYCYENSTHKTMTYRVYSVNSDVNLKFFLTGKLVITDPE